LIIGFFLPPNPDDALGIVCGRVAGPAEAEASCSAIPKFDRVSGLVPPAIA
jgi:hypothetical protein